MRIATAISQQAEFRFGRAAQGSLTREAQLVAAVLLLVDRSREREHQKRARWTSFQPDGDVACCVVDRLEEGEHVAGAADDGDVEQRSV